MRILLAVFKHARDFYLHGSEDDRGLVTLALNNLVIGIRHLLSKREDQYRDIALSLMPASWEEAVATLPLEEETDGISLSDQEMRELVAPQEGDEL
ncbi:hypothetical protein [Nonomuraea africana]|uniref:Membrane protein n=1 Tax=Nonomuraea africana TaxID=46171 RepID=A0ABR9K8C1_9ACTN|nr:hypothetical protein [Nonomuraea africana]MBE1558256.1 putative membrane protein [Nonomuraea africana]